MITEEELDFLRESNNIEEEWDDKALQDAILAWQYILTFDKLSIRAILDTHKRLMQTRTTLYDEERGALRKPVRDHSGQVWIAGKEGKPWIVLPQLINNWIERANTTLEHPGLALGEREESIVADHIAFEEMHPFIDGNGRTGRILMNWQRVKVGLPVDIIYASEKYDYYEWFK